MCGTEKGRGHKHTGAVVHTHTVRYLARFGLVPYSFFGLFFSNCYIFLRFGHILLNVVYYVTLKNKQQQQYDRAAAVQFRLNV